jgi:hypothetical protein
LARPKALPDNDRAPSYGRPVWPVDARLESRLFPLRTGPALRSVTIDVDSPRPTCHGRHPARSTSPGRPDPRGSGIRFHPRGWGSPLTGALISPGLRRCVVAPAEPSVEAGHHGSLSCDQPHRVAYSGGRSGDTRLGGSIGFDHVPGARSWRWDLPAVWSETGRAEHHRRALCAPGHRSRPRAHNDRARHRRHRRWFGRPAPRGRRRDR